MLTAAARRKGPTRDILDKPSDPVPKGKGRTMRQLLFKVGVVFNPRTCAHHPHVLTEGRGGRGPVSPVRQRSCDRAGDKPATCSGDGGSLACGRGLLCLSALCCQHAVPEHSDRASRLSRAFSCTWLHGWRVTCAESGGVGSSPRCDEPASGFG